MEAPGGTRVGYGAVEVDGPTVPVPAAPRTQHVWVNLAETLSRQPTLEYPGLVTEWRRYSKGWEAHVVYTTPDTGSGRLAVHMTWLPAHLLRPASEA